MDHLCSITFLSHKFCGRLHDFQSVTVKICYFFSRPHLFRDISTGPKRVLPVQMTGISDVTQTWSFATETSSSDGGDVTRVKGTESTKAISIVRDCEGRCFKVHLKLQSWKLILFDITAQKESDLHITAQKKSDLHIYYVAGCRLEFY